MSPDATVDYLDHFQRRVIQDGGRLVAPETCLAAPCLTAPSSEAWRCDYCRGLS